MVRPVDRIDEKLLAILQTNNQLTCQDMAQQVSISASSCRRRIDALRRDGVIIGDVSLVNPEVLGHRLTVTALVTLERDTPDGHATFRRAMLEVPEIVSCEYVAGHFDYVVRFELASMEQYELLSDRHMTANPSVKRVESLVVIRGIKGRREALHPLARRDSPAAD